MSLSHQQRMKQIQAFKEAEAKRKAEEEAKASQAPQEPGLMGRLWNSWGFGGGSGSHASSADTSPLLDVAEDEGGELEVENPLDVESQLDDLAEGLGGEAKFGEDEDEDEDEGEEGGEQEEGGSSWYDWLPSIGWKREQKQANAVRLLGDHTAEQEEGEDEGGAAELEEDNYLDLLSSKSEVSASAKIGAKGAQAEFETAKEFAMLKGAAKGDLTTDDMREDGLSLEAGVSGSLLEAGASAKGAAKFDREKMAASAEGKAEAGAYLAKVGAEGELGWKVPFLNARLFGKGEVEGNVGVGAQAKGKAKLDANGFEMGGKMGASAGLGGSLGFSWGVKKDDDKKGWLG